MEAITEAVPNRGFTKASDGVVVIAAVVANGVVGGVPKGGGVACATFDPKIEGELPNADVPEPTNVKELLVTAFVSVVGAGAAVEVTVGGVACEELTKPVGLDGTLLTLGCELPKILSDGATMLDVSAPLLGFVATVGFTNEVLPKTLGPVGGVDARAPKTGVLEIEAGPKADDSDFPKLNDVELKTGSVDFGAITVVVLAGSSVF